MSLPVRIKDHMESTQRQASLEANMVLDRRYWLEKKRQFAHEHPKNIPLYQMVQLERAFPKDRFPWMGDWDKGDFE